MKGGNGKESDARPSRGHSSGVKEVVAGKQGCGQGRLCLVQYLLFARILCIPSILAPSTSRQKQRDVESR